jgi:hypothetical protein
VALESRVAAAEAAHTDRPAAALEMELVAAVERRLLDAIRAEVSGAAEKAAGAAEKASALEAALGEVGHQLQTLTEAASEQAERRLEENAGAASEAAVLGLAERQRELAETVAAQEVALAAVARQPVATKELAEAAGEAALAATKELQEGLARADGIAGELGKQVAEAWGVAEAARLAAEMATGDAAFAFTTATKAQAGLAAGAAGGAMAGSASDALVERVDAVAASVRQAADTQVLAIIIVSLYMENPYWSFYYSSSPRSRRSAGRKSSPRPTAPSSRSWRRAWGPGARRSRCRPQPCSTRCSMPCIVPHTVMGCHSLGVHTVILRPLLSFSAAMTVSPLATCTQSVLQVPHKTRIRTSAGAAGPAAADRPAPRTARPLRDRAAVTWGNIRFSFQRGGVENI